MKKNREVFFKKGKNENPFDQKGVKGPSFFTSHRKSKILEGIFEKFAFFSFQRFEGRRQKIENFQVLKGKWKNHSIKNLEKGVPH
jgi:hypothetical protein